MKTNVISVGGSIIVPDEIDTSFLSNLRDRVMKRVKNGERIILVCGGGGLNRTYLDAAKKLSEVPDEKADLLGIYATKLNAMLVLTLFGDDAHPVVIEDPTADFKPEGHIIVASGWKPGFSSDYDAVVLADKFGAEIVVNMSNIEYVYDKDPSQHKDAKKFDAISWDDYLGLIQEKWSPRLSTPFDPIASRLAKEKGISVAIVKGTNLENVENVLDDREFTGTLIE